MQGIGRVLDLWVFDTGGHWWTFRVEGVFISEGDWWVFASGLRAEQTEEKEAI